MSLSEHLSAQIGGLLAAHPVQQIALLFATALVAGMARGFSGFGGALIFVPLASALAGPRVATPLLLVIDGIMTLGMLPDAVRRATKREVATVLIGSVVGVPAGTALLALASPLALRWAISLIVLGLLLFLISGWRYKGQPKLPLSIATGTVAGLFGGISQLSGPPVVAYWLGGTIHRATVRANLVVYFALASVVSAVAYVAAGLLTLESLLLAAAVGPGYGLGLAVGSSLFGLADEATFRRICYVLIGAAAVISLPLMDPLLK
ncbi:MAG: sulfite exporter TauE/SafE family protein [Pseudorhizobium sp.]